MYDFVIEKLQLINIYIYSIRKQPDTFEEITDA